MTPANPTPKPALNPTPGAGGRFRLMQLVLSLGPGGTERLVIDMSKHLMPRADITVCCLDEPGGWAHELTELGIPLVALRRPAGFRPSLARQIRQLAREHGTQVMHCHHYSPFIYGCLASLMQRQWRLIYTEHGRLSDAPPSPKRKMANRVFGRMPGRFFAVSQDLREHMLAEGFPAQRVGVIHNGIAPGPVTTPTVRAEARRLLNLPEDALVIATVARLDPVKDLPNLVRAFAPLRKSNAKALLVIIGDGPEEQNIRDAAAQEGVSDGLRFTGRRDDVRRLLPGFDLYVNSSVTEGVSVTILEAMAAGLAVVATRVGGTPEVLIDGQTALLVPSRSPADLGGAIARLARDPALAKQLGEAGRQRLETHFAVDRMIEQYLEAYGVA